MPTCLCLEEPTFAADDAIVALKGLKPKKKSTAVAEEEEEEEAEAVDQLPDGLPSIGSSEHFKGNCRPCFFFRRGNCSRHKNCSHCHFQHERAKHPGKRTRDRVKLQALWQVQAEAT